MTPAEAQTLSLVVGAAAAGFFGAAWLTLRKIRRDLPRLIQAVLAAGNVTILAEARSRRASEQRPPNQKRRFGG